MARTWYAKGERLLGRKKHLSSWEEAFLGRTEKEKENEGRVRDKIYRRKG